MNLGAFFQMWLVVVIGLSSLGSAHAIVLGPVQGKSVAGQPISLSSHVSRLSEHQVGQLKESCLKAQLRPFTGNPDIDNKPGSESWMVRAQFVRMGANSGEIFFDAPPVQGDVSLSLQLESHCPLATFEQRWTVFLEPAGLAGTTVAQPPVQRPVEQTQQAQFDFENSRLLAQSLQPPKSPGQSNPSRRTAARPDQPGADDGPDASGSTMDHSPAQDEQDSPSDSSPIHLASVDPNLLQYAPSDAQFIQQPQHDSTWSHTGVLAIGGALILCVLPAVYFVLNRRTAGSAPANPPTLWRRDPPTTPVEPVLSPLVPEPAHAMDANGVQLNERKGISNRVLESFYTPDHSDSSAFVQEAGAPMFDMEVETRQNSAVERALSLVNRGGMSPWNLPESYAGLVAQRNLTLTELASGGLRILQCQLGLVELAFQEASAGRSLQADQSNEFLASLLGEEFATHLQQEWPTLPDIVRTYVRAKFCEVTGASARQRLKENLLALVDDPPAGKTCFDRSLWLELLAEQVLSES
ncbi:MAG TPA: hypothetical protein VFV39_04595 [Limnobacter sp.]|nr:hypothetical protein [Limnobacter sp.]